jgi:hypothetical protein
VATKLQLNVWRMTSALKETVQDAGLTISRVRGSENNNYDAVSLSYLISLE